MSVTVVTERRQDVALVKLTRPETNNALNIETITRLRAAFEDISADASISAVVLSGEGKSLCAGADIGWMRDSGTLKTEENVDDLMRLGHMLQTLRQMPQTTIVRVHGPIYGGGVGLVAACDIAIGSTGATFCLSEVRLGIAPGMIAPYVQRVMGERMARRYFQTAEVFDAEEARRLGLLHEVVPTECLDERVDKLINQLRFAAPAARAAAKLITDDIAGDPVNEALLSDIAAFTAGLRSRPDAREGLPAFFEKRKPRWR